MDDCMKTGEVARLLRVCNDTIRAWAERGWLKGVRLPNNHWCFQRGDVMAIAERMTGNKEIQG